MTAVAWYKKNVMDSALIGVLLTGIAGLFGAIITGWLSVQKHKSDAEMQKESFIVNELKGIISQQDKEFDLRMKKQEDEYKARIIEIRRERDIALTRLSLALTDNSSAKERINFYESLLEQNNIRFRPWHAPSIGGSSHSMDTVREE